MKLAAVFAVAVAALLLVLLLLQTSPGSAQPGHTQQAPPKSDTQTSTQPKGEKTDIQTPSQQEEKTGTQTLTQPVGEKTNTQTPIQQKPQSHQEGAATAQSVPPPGWRIVVEAGRYVEYPAKIYKRGEWREVFYLWNGTLYYDVNFTYARIVGRVISYQPKNETVKRIIGTNPAQYILYNVTWYPLYNYQPQANTTPVKFRTYVIITRYTKPHGYLTHGYRVEGQLPVSQIMWTVYLSFFNLTDKVPLRIAVQSVKLNITEAKTLLAKSTSMTCVETECAWGPGIEIVD
jgi:hypothetical protein